MQLAMINEEILPLEAIPDAYLDRAMYFGDGVYEVIRSYDGRLFAIDEHMKRFSNSLDGIAITGVDIEQIRKKVEKAYEQSQIRNARIYFHISRGSSLREHVWSADMKPNFLLIITEIGDYSSVKENGISVCTCEDLRWKRCDIKSLNLLPNILARNNAAARGFDEAILVDENNLITEGSGSSFFGIFGWTLRTSPLSANILPSVSRHYILQIAPRAGLAVEQKSMTPEEARDADELFIAVTTKDVVPVVRFDDVEISNSQPGEFTKKLITQYEHLTRGE